MDTFFPAGGALQSKGPMKTPKTAAVNPERKTIHEAGREVPVSGHADVIVCGGGPAGIGAALAAARTGAKVRVIEVNGCLGGVWTAGQLAWLFEMDQPGITREITRRLDARGARTNVCTHNTDKYAYDIEAMKLLLEEMLAEAGVEFHLHSRVVAPVREGRELKAVITESKSGREAWTATHFIDASGDGDLAALSGCGFDMGKPDTGALQPFTFMAMVTAKNAEALKPFVVFSGGFVHDGFSGPTRRFREEIQSAGEDPSYRAATLFHIRGNLMGLMINHEYGVSPINERDVTRATVRGRAEVNRVVEALKKKGGIWEGFQIVSTPDQIGTREGRRIHGCYTVTQEDLFRDARHEDAVCRVTYWIDVHSTDPKKGKGFEAPPQKTGSTGGDSKEPPAPEELSYDIPLRALISKDVDNLMMAGRCISGDFLAHSSYRVTGVAVALGQAAGAASALAAQKGINVARLPFPLLEQALEKIRM